MGLLDGKVAIITGAGNGIGRQHALQFAAAGAKVVVNDLGGSRDGTGAGSMAADSVAKEIKAAGGEAVADFSNVATLDGADALLWRALDKFGGIDIVVNNAGILRDRTLVNMSEAEWDAVQAVHLKGTFLVSRAAVRLMKVQGRGGRIINTSSVSGLNGNIGQANYAAAKAGVFGFTRTLAQELARFNITCNAIAPVALTRMTEDLSLMAGASEEVIGPQHISPAVVFLASELAKDISGKVLGVEGGRLFEYRMMTSEGVVKDVLKEGAWTPEEIQAKWAEITKFGAPV
jgi:NAD(P)-dependent dehydrogenase (short-subunit alcohol dehydrogenase family)